MLMTSNIAQDIFSFEGASQCFVCLKFYVTFRREFSKNHIKNSSNENISMHGCIEHN